MKKVIIAASLIVASFAVKSQIADTSFTYLSAKIQYSKQAQTVTNLHILSHKGTIQADYLLSLMESNKKLQCNEVFLLLAKCNEATPEILSTVIVKYKNLQNDTCYFAYKQKQPSSTDIAWLKLSVVDIRNSQVFNN